MRKKFIPLAVIVLLAVAACATSGPTDWRNSAKKTVVASTKVYELAMHVAGSSGLSAPRQAEVVRIANIYRAAATAALDAADSGDQAGFDAHVAEFSKAIADLTTLLQGGKP